MSTGALTSGCSLTRTWCVPTVLIGSRTSIRRRSSSGPPASRTAAAMSAGPTEPNRRPLPPARRPGPLDQLDLLLGATGPGHREAARDQVIAAVASRHVHHVTGGAETAHF